MRRPALRSPRRALPGLAARLGLAWPACLRPWLLLALLLALPGGLAQAHTPIEGIGGLLNGVLHPLLVPEHVLALLAAGLLIGQQREAGMRVAVPAFMVAVGAGLAALWLAVPAQAALPLLIATATCAALVALAAPLALPVWVSLTVATGLLLGLDSVPEGLSGNERIAALVGTGIGASLVLLYVAGLTENLERPWQRLAIRIAGSWLIAITVMVLALSFARFGGGAGAVR